MKQIDNKKVYFLKISMQGIRMIWLCSTKNYLRSLIILRIPLTNNNLRYSSLNKMIMTWMTTQSSQQVTQYVISRPSVKSLTKCETQCLLSLLRPKSAYFNPSKGSQKMIACVTARLISLTAKMAKIDQKLKQFSEVVTQRIYIIKFTNFHIFLLIISK